MKKRFCALLAGALAFSAPLEAEPNVTVTGTTYNSGAVVSEWAQYTLQTGGAVTVKNGANVAFSAGSQITLYPGFSIEPGGIFKAVASSPPSYNPGGYYTGSAPTLVILSGDQQYGAVGNFNSQPFDIAVFNTAGTIPLVNAPVLLTVSAGGGWLSATNDIGAVLSKSLYLTTDSEGTVNAYYKHGSTVDVTSYIQVVAGSANVQIETYSAILDTTAPTVPEGLAASNITEAGFKLDWAESTDAVGTVEYLVFKNGVQIGDAITARTITLSGLNPGVAYSMTVKAKDTAGNVSAASEPLVVTTADITPPLAPANLASSLVTATSFKLTWDAPFDNVGVTHYLIYKDDVALGDPVTATTLIVSGLTPTTAYSMTVKAKDAAGNISALSTALVVTTHAPLSGTPGADYDSDGMSDEYELANGLDPFLSDGAGDLDGDLIWNDEDARPQDNAIGQLSIIINSPADASVIN